MDHKHYFKTLEELGRKAVVDLRQTDVKHTALHKEYLEQRMRGDITEQGYKGLVKALQDSRLRVVDGYRVKMEELKQQYAKAIDADMMPAAGRMNPEDIALLNTFELTPAEFERMADKYSDNPTMGRYLEAYRAKHEGQPMNTTPASDALIGSQSGEKWHTSWHFQTANERKATFGSACGCVESIMGQSDKYSPDRENGVTRSVYGYYHAIQGSNPDELPVPEEKPFEGVIGNGNSTFF